MNKEILGEDENKKYDKKSCDMKYLWTEDYQLFMIMFVISIRE